MPELRHLRYFIAVAEESNFRRAAERLNITQPALWRQVRDLELDLGFPLILRTQRSSTLTPAGRSYLSSAKEILARVADARHAAYRVSVGETGLLRIAFNQIAARESFLPTYLQEFRLRYPDVALDVKVQISQHQQEELLQRRIDAGFMFNRPANDERFVAYKVMDDSLVLALPRTHRLANQPALALQDIAQEPLIAPSATSNAILFDRIVAQFAAANLTPLVIQRSDDENSLFNMVAAGMGLAFVNASAMRLRQIDQLAVRKVEGFSVPLHLELVWRKDDDSPVLRRFVEVVTTMEPPMSDAPWASMLR